MTFRHNQIVPLGNASKYPWGAYFL